MGPANLTPGKESERISVFLRKDQLAALRGITATVGIPVAVLIRQGVDLILAQHGKAPATAARKGGRR
jgi:hypothetical protein